MAFADCRPDVPKSTFCRIRVTGPFIGPLNQGMVRWTFYWFTDPDSGEVPKRDAIMVDCPSGANPVACAPHVCSVASVRSVVSVL